MEYTESELVEKLGIKRQSLSSYRKGYKAQKTRRNGEVYTYEYKPRLIEGEDYEWRQGCLVYFESAVLKLKKPSK